VTSKKLKNNFALLVISCLGTDVARGPPVEHTDLNLLFFIKGVKYVSNKRNLNILIYMEIQALKF
jgi:hypothetical protein